MASIKGTNQDDDLYGTMFKEHINGKKGDDSLVGNAGNDKLKGGDGNDFLFGGGGNDDLDGGKGVDTAFYRGAIDDYVIDFSDKKNPKGTVCDTVDGRDGLDKVKNVEILQFADAVVNLQSGQSWNYAVNAVLSNSAQDPASPGNMYAGSGLPADNFGIATNADAGVELGLKVHKRFDTPFAIGSTDNYADGELHFTVDAGPGNPPTNNRAEWNFDFSVATGLNGATTDLGDFKIKLLVDVDKTAGVNYRTWVLEPEPGPPVAGQSGYQWRDVGTGLVVIADDEGTGNVTQNSQNFGFGHIRAFIDDNPALPGTQLYNFGPGEFDIVLQAFDASGVTLVAQNHIVVDVV